MLFLAELNSEISGQCLKLLTFIGVGLYALKMLLISKSVYLLFILSFNCRLRSYTVMLPFHL